MMWVYVVEGILIGIVFIIAGIDRMQDEASFQRRLDSVLRQELAVMNESLIKHRMMVYCTRRDK